MRWYGQVAVIAVAGAAGYGVWDAHRSGTLATWPVVGPLASAYLPGSKPTGPAPAGAPRGGGPPPTVDVDTVRTGRIVETREAVGTLRAYESITVTSKASGVVQEILFAEGGLVKAGDPLVRFDAAERIADIQQAVAEVIRASAQRDEIRQKLDRAQQLRRSGSGTEAQVDDLAAQLRSAEGAIGAASARQKAAEARLDDLSLKAPFSGRLGTRQISLGAYVSPGTRITTLDDLSRVRLDFAVPENLLARVQVGQNVSAFAAAFPDRAFKGTVTLIDPRVDPTTRSVKMTAEFENADETLKAGMFLSVSLEVTTRENAVVIPEEAIVNEWLRHIVYVVKADKTVDRRVVRIGQRRQGSVEILDGLAAGETLVVLGVQRVRPGGAVVPRPIGADAAKGRADEARTKPVPGPTANATPRT